MKKTSVYLLCGGNKSAGYYFMPEYFNYKKSAIKMRDFLYSEGKPGLRKLKVVKFTSEELP